MNILWISNSPNSPSGYGQQTAEITKRLVKRGYKVTILQTYTVGRNKEFHGARLLYPNPDFPCLQDLDMYAVGTKADLVIYLGDPWVRGPEPFEKCPVPVACWYPLDSYPVPSPDLDVFAHVQYVLTLGQHGYKSFKELGIETTIIPHVVDTSVFKPIPDLRDPDSYTVGLIQANVGTRKLLHIQMEALAIARRDIPNLRAYWHANPQGSKKTQSLDYVGLIEYLGIDDFFHVPGGLGPDDIPTANPKLLAETYNRFDMLLQTTAGEGFGIPIIEAMACGIPVITTRNSEPQYLNPGIQVDPVVKEYVSYILTFHSWPRPEDVAAAILEQYNSEVDSEFLVNYASQFDADRVVEEHWIPFLESV